VTDTPICGHLDQGVMCRAACTTLPDGTPAERCTDHLGLPDPEPAAPFAAQRPSPEPAAQVRVSMLDCLEASLRAVAERGLLRFPDLDTYPRRVAGVLLDDLASDVLSKTLQGMAVGSMAP
jgi:hypothetical protein